MKRIQASAAPLRAALSALLLGAGVLHVSPALGQATSTPPERMTYQGFLVGSDGVALGNLNNPKNYDVVFKIYDAENGGTLLWGEQQTVTVDKGYFSVLLGEGSPVGNRPALSTLFKGATASDRFVGITVQGIGAGGANVDILPRLRLMTSPYAFLAQNAVKLVQNNAAGTDLITSSGNAVTVSGGLAVTGNNVFELGAGIAGKEGSAGKFGYAIFTPGALDIVGAGTAVEPRNVKIWAEGGTTFTGPVTATVFNGSGEGLTGVAKPDVLGNLRLGSDGLSGSAGWGSALIFSGAPAGDNTDPLWLARYNTAANSSELRVAIGDDPGSLADRFVIGTMQGAAGFSQSATWAPQFAFTAKGMLEFRPGIAKEVSAGTIGYQVHSSDSLDIVGAGTTGSNRKVQIWSEAGLQLNGGINIGGGMKVNSYNGTTFEVTANYTRLYNADNKAKSVIMFRDASALYFRVDGGTSQGGSAQKDVVYDGDSNWDFYSDRRLKKDIIDAESMLDRALKVQVRRYRWIGEDEGGRHKMGVIAQELQPLFPDLVSEHEDPESKEMRLTVGYGDFAVIAIKAIQELKVQQDAEVKELKAQVADLKAQMKEVLQAAAELRSQADKSKVTASVSK